MVQKYAKYTDWEDYKAGMYELNLEQGKWDKVFRSVNLFMDSKNFYSAMCLVLDKWVVASDVNLTNLNINRRAWLGAAACMINHDCPEFLTRIAWGLLDKKDQELANIQAERIIKKYERKNRTVRIDVGTEVLF